MVVRCLQSLTVSPVHLMMSLMMSLIQLIIKRHMCYILYMWINNVNIIKCTCCGLLSVDVKTETIIIIHLRLILFVVTKVNSSLYPHVMYIMLLLMNYHEM